MADKKITYITGLGRRKTSVARVHMRPGSGSFVINGLEKDKYLPTEEYRKNVLAPLKSTDNLKKFDIVVTVRGGGYTGQVGAIVLGISRSLLKNDETLLGKLKEFGYLTRDSRMKERKKYGLHGARRATQFSKR
ncbi:MAG: 30S ribosomal protein S9 [Planctomycetota bacterium]|nr:MAG: 30S ribosomal protein S9 [Planctomycetota bacterium]